MAANKTLTTKPSDPEEVDQYMGRLTHPLAEVVQQLRGIILKSDPAIG